MVASASRRATIIKNQRRPPDFIVARYTEAEKAIVDYLTSKEPSLDSIYSAQKELMDRLRSAGSEWEAQRLLLCHDALDCFAEHVDVFDLDNADVTASVERTGKLSMAGVEVSVRPELGLARIGRNGPQSGLVKLYFRKNSPLTEEQAQYISAGLFQWGATGSRPVPSLSPSWCLVFDIFAGNSFRGKRSHRRRVADLEAACEEIAHRWPLL